MSDDEERSVSIEHSPDTAHPVYFTVPGAFEKRHLVTPRPMWTFVDEGEWPVFAFVCDLGTTVGPEEVERREDVPDGLCSHCDNSLEIAFQRGPEGELEVSSDE